VPALEGSVIVIQPSLLATGEGEKIIRTAEVRLEVEDGKEAYKGLLAICQGAGGYLASSRLNRDTDDRSAGYVTMRIPKAKFTEVLDRLRDFGHIRNITTNSQDVSQEYKNLKEQLDAEMVVYNKILEALKKKQNTIPEAIRRESELTPVLQRVEALKNQLEALDNSVSYTTITVYFSEPQVSLKTLQQSGHFIRESLIVASLNAVKSLAKILPAAVAFVFGLLIVFVIGIVLKAWITKIFKKG
jgi:polyhydroxyalkanoate synthesis regulator phasin